MRGRLAVVTTGVVLVAVALVGCDEEPVTPDASASLEQLVLLAIEAAEDGDAAAATRSLDRLRDAVERLRADGALRDDRAEEILRAAAQAEALLALLEPDADLPQRSSPGPSATIAAEDERGSDSEPTDGGSPADDAAADDPGSQTGATGDADSQTAPDEATGGTEEAGDGRGNRGSPDDAGTEDDDPPGQRGRGTGDDPPSGPPDHAGGGPPDHAGGGPPDHGGGGPGRGRPGRG